MFGTGYQVDVARYGFLSEAPARAARRVDGYPVLTRGLESSVAGLHFMGAPAAWSFGPIMRFVSGSWYGASAVARGSACRRAGAADRRQDLGARRAAVSRDPGDRRRRPEALPPRRAREGRVRAPARW